MNDQFPFWSAIVVPIGAPPSRIVTVEFGSAVPEIVGVLSFVAELFVGEVITGALGAVESITTLTTFDKLLTNDPTVEVEEIE